MLVRCALVLGLAGCSSVLGIGELTGPPDSGPPTDDVVPLPVCQAQRVVHLVGGNGALGWFTQIWPVPANVTAFTATVSLDDPTFFVDRSVAGTHPLFVREVPVGGTRGLWDGRGADPQPTVFLAGQNETHTNTPNSAITSGTNGLVAAGAAIQASLAPRVPVLIIGLGPFGTAVDAPAVMNAQDVAQTVSALASAGTISVTEADMLQPSQAQLARYFDSSAPMLVAAFGTRMAFIANAFRINLFGSVILQVFDDDPTGVFADPVNMVTPRANQLANILDAFYADLDGANELGCGKPQNQPLGLADNTVMLVTGDTYKQPFDRNGWADGTPLNTNLMFVRGNGFLKPGWFGSLTTTATNFFDPVTGVVSAGATRVQDSDAAWAAALYAIARGDRSALTRYTNMPFDGAVAQ